MDLYTLDSHTFLPRKAIDEFSSLIWTERYSAAGDVQLVVPAIPELVNELSPGRILALRGTKEIMVIESESREKGLLTVTGSSLVKSFDQREAWFINPEYDATSNPQLYADYTDDKQTAGPFLATVVDKLVISPTDFDDPYIPINFDWVHDKIKGLSLGQVDTNGIVKRLTFPLGPLYTGIQQFASNQRLGFKLYLESATTTGYSLKFASYRGSDRTSDQTDRPVVRLTTKMDSLLSSKDLIATTNYKNVVYVNFKNEISMHFLGAAPATNFARFVIRVDAPDVNVKDDDIPAFRQQVAMNAFFQHAYIAAVDGQVSPQSGFIFQNDYYLGDVIELEGDTGLRSVAQVTEFIRSQDQYGVKAYPTLAVPDLTLFDFNTDLDPNPSDKPWHGDPGYDDGTNDGDPAVVVNHNPDGPGGPTVIGGITGGGDISTGWGAPDDLIIIGWTLDHKKLVAKMVGDRTISFWLVNPNGTGRYQLTDTVGHEWNPDYNAIWANSDRTRHWYAVRKHSGAFNIYWNTTGAVEDLALLFNPNPFPSDTHVLLPVVKPSPSGLYLYLEVGIHRYICNYDGTNLHEIDLPGSEPAWVPGSDKLVTVDHDSGVWVIYDPATGATYTSEPHGNPDAGDKLGGVWISPDGHKAVWTIVRYDNSVELWGTQGDPAPTGHGWEMYYANIDETGPNDVWPENGVAWSFDSIEILVVDGRPFEISTGVTWIFLTSSEGWVDHFTVFAGTLDPPPYISNPQLFEAI